VGSSHECLLITSTLLSHHRDLPVTHLDESWVTCSVYIIQLLLFDYVISVYVMGS
jgi:hypothetical protein